MNDKLCTYCVLNLRFYKEYVFKRFLFGLRIPYDYPQCFIAVITIERVVHIPGIRRGYVVTGSFPLLKGHVATDRANLLSNLSSSRK